MDNPDHDSLPIDNPRLSAILGWVYKIVFEPINKIIDRLESRFTNKLINENADPRDKLN